MQTKRGKVVRDTSTGTGLIVIDQQQFPFVLEGVWRSEVAPRVNMSVEVGFDGQGQMLSVTAISESQLAREQTEEAVRVAKEKGQAVGRELLGRFGVGTLAGMAALVCGWFVFNAINIRVTGQYSTGFSFWKLLGMLNSPAGFMQAIEGGGFGGGTGAYGLFAVIALCGPLLPFVLRHRLAWLGNLLPLAFIVVVCLSAYLGMADGMRQAQGAALAFGGQQAARMAEEMASTMMTEALRAVSFGLGAYLAMIASLYFAGRGVVQGLLARS